MSSRYLILFLVLSLPVPSASFAEPRCPGDIAPVRYHPTRSGRIEISVTIDGSGPYNFIVDTGTQMTIIEPSLAAELHLQPETSAPIISGVRMDRADLVRPGSIEVGHHIVRLPLVAVMSLAQMQGSDPEIRGILGESFLMRFDLLLHLGHRILCLDQTNRMQQKVSGEHIAVIPSADFPNNPEIPQPILIPVRLAEFGSRAVILRLDSGTSAPLLYNHRLVVTASSLAHRRHAEVAGNAQELFTTLPAQDVHIGKHLLHDVAFATSVDTTGNPVLHSEDGLLPTALFERVFISYANHFVVLEPR
jgi:Aspartyl protease